MFELAPRVVWPGAGTCPWHTEAGVLQIGLQERNQGAKRYPGDAALGSLLPQYSLWKLLAVLCALAESLLHCCEQPWFVLIPFRIWLIPAALHERGLRSGAACAVRAVRAGVS